MELRVYECRSAEKVTVSANFWTMFISLKLGMGLERENQDEIDACPYPIKFKMRASEWACCSPGLK
jgi:hypothetical protein